MKKLSLPTLYFLLLLFSLAGKAQQKVLYFSEPPAGFAASKISKASVAEDLAWWQQVMEESHVNPYHAISKKSLESLQKRLLSTLPDSISHAQACFAVSEVIGALNEGHLGFATNAVVDSLYANHSVRFPYLLDAIDSGAFIVQRDLSNSNRLPPGSRIVEVAGIASAELYSRYAKFFGGLEPWRRVMVKNNIRRLLYLDGIESPFKIKAAVGGDTLLFMTGGYTARQADSLNKVLAAALPNVEPFSLRFLEDKVALIEFNTMNGRLRDSFAAFLGRSFAAIQQRGPEGLIIDLRKNGGGDSGLGDLLLGYISNKPYRDASGVKLRISKHSKAYAALTNTADAFKDQKAGKLYEYKIDKLIQPKENPLRYSGKVAVLIGAGTFSSANMLANAVKDYKLATLIGEPTAEPANDFGEIFSFMLPRTHIVVNGATKMFTRANGDEKDFNGIKPDIYASNNGSKEDEVMEMAVEWIKK